MRVWFWRLEAERFAPLLKIVVSGFSTNFADVNVDQDDLGRTGGHAEHVACLDPH